MTFTHAGVTTLEYTPPLGASRSRLPTAGATPIMWHWVDGGPTGLDNLMLLCRKHHRAVHEGEVELPALE